MTEYKSVEQNESISAGTSNLVKAYYTGNALSEWKRLVKDPYHRLELETTLFFLKKHLPSTGLVLDAGGGPGRYTIELAKLGYTPVLLDFAPSNLEIAKKRIKRAGLRTQVKEIIEGSIVDLTRFADNTFDAVICTGGPLSHVVDRGDREKAVAELVRVAKPGAPIFVSVMSRLSVLVVELTIGQSEIELPLFKCMRDTGDYYGGHGFTACHFFLPEELRDAFIRQPVDILEMAGLEGISSHHRRELNLLAKDKKRFDIWMETHYLTCTHPAVVGLSEHMLIICKKTGVE